MSEPRRLIDGDGPGRLLVASMQREGLSPEAKLRLRASLGLGVGAAGVATLASTTSAASTASAGAAKGAVIATSAKSVGGIVVAKWVGIVALGGVAVGGAGLVARTVSTGAPTAVVSPSPSPSGSSHVTPVTRNDPRPDETAREVAVQLPPEVDQANAPSAPTSPQTAQAPAHRAKASAPSGGTDRGDLSEELRLLEIARRSLRAGDAAGALVELQHYRANAPRSVLGEEADALEVEALIANGRRDEATAKGRAFVARHPRGPLSERVARLTATEPPPR